MVELVRCESNATDLRSSAVGSDYPRITKVRSSQVKQQRSFHCSLWIGEKTRACLSAKATLRTKIEFQRETRRRNARGHEFQWNSKPSWSSTDFVMRFARTFLFHFALCSFFPLPLVCCSTVYGRGTHRRNREIVVTNCIWRLGGQKNIFTSLPRW